MEADLELIKGIKNKESEERKEPASLVIQKIQSEPVEYPKGDSSSDGTAQSQAIATTSNNLDDNMVVALVWRPKDQQGRVVKSSIEAATSGGSVGHVALRIFIKGQEKLYISFWPSETISTPFQEVKAEVSTIGGDIAKEEGGLPEAYYLNQLDGQQIKNAFFKHLQETNSKPHYTLLPISNPIWRKIMWIGNDCHNCCTITLRLIEAGLISLGTKKNDPIYNYIDVMKKKSPAHLDPTLLAGFFKFLSDVEDKIEDVKKRKAQFVKDIEMKLEKIAKKGLSVELDLYGGIYPEIYQRIKPELDVQANLRKELRQLVDSGDVKKIGERIEGVKQRHPSIYDKFLKQEIEERLQSILLRTLKEIGKIANLLMNVTIKGDVNLFAVEYGLVQMGMFATEIANPTLEQVINQIGNNIQITALFDVLLALVNIKKCLANNFAGLTPYPDIIKKVLEDISVLRCLDNNQDKSVQFQTRCAEIIEISQKLDNLLKTSDITTSQPELSGSIPEVTKNPTQQLLQDGHILPQSHPSFSSTTGMIQTSLAATTQIGGTSSKVLIDSKEQPKERTSSKHKLEQTPSEQHEAIETTKEREQSRSTKRQKKDDDNHKDTSGLSH